MSQDILPSLVEVELKKPDDFLIVKETLTRIGIPVYRTNTLYQSCHILHKRGKYYIVHFKELFLLDGKSSNFDESDLGRRNSIARALDTWGLVKIVDKDKVNGPLCPMNKIKIIPSREKGDWNLVTKYNIGGK